MHLFVLLLARFIQNVLRSTLLFANKSTKQCIQFLNKPLKPISKDSSHRIFQNVFRKISTPCSKEFCQLRTYAKRWYWQLYVGSKRTVFSILRLKMAVYTILLLHFIECEMMCYGALKTNIDQGRRPRLMLLFSAP